VKEHCTEVLLPACGDTIFITKALSQLCICVVMCSVCGLIVPQEDLPFNDLGICPDVVSETFISSLTAVMHNLTDITPLDADNTLINGVQQDAIQLRTEPSYQ